VERPAGGLVERPAGGLVERPAGGLVELDRSVPSGPGPSDGAEHPSRANGRHWPRWVLRPIVIYLMSRAVTLGTMAVCGIVTHRSIPREARRWDSLWFLKAAAHGWPRQLPMHHGHVAGNTAAFFPLFPLSIRWSSQLTGLSPLATGMAISEVSGLTAMIGVWMLVRNYSDQSAADRATLLVAVFPGTFVMSLVYSEGLAVSFVAFGILALMRRRWLLAGVLGMLATATAPVALAFEVSCLWCAYRAIATDRDWRSLWAPVLAPLGFVAYQLWLWRHTGNLAGWRVTERGGWRSYPSLLYPVHVVTTFVRSPAADTLTGDLLFVGTMATAIAAVVAIRSRLPMPALLYGLAAAGVGLVSAPIGLRPRFIFLAFPLIVAVGTRLRGRAYLAVVCLSTVLLVVAMAFSIDSFKVFP
jgi:hypothetical protein